jgi:hypothetical protein
MPPSSDGSVGCCNSPTACTVGYKYDVVFDDFCSHIQIWITNNKTQRSGRRPRNICSPHSEMWVNIASRSPESSKTKYNFCNNMSPSHDSSYSIPRTITHISQCPHDGSNPQSGRRPRNICSPHRQMWGSTNRQYESSLDDGIKPNKDPTC